MNPIDLIYYTKTSNKIPGQLLKHKPVEIQSVKTWKIFTAYAIDYSTLVCMTAMLSVFLELAFKNYMVTQQLESAFSKIGFSAFAFNFLPLVFVTYYFFSFFFNHGQSWGMSVMKNRIEMKEHSFRSSFYWAMISSIIMMTGGLALIFARNWLQKKSWGDFRTHDHLYSILMQERYFSPVNLIDLSSDMNDKKEVQESEERYVKAA